MGGVVNVPVELPHAIELPGAGLEGSVEEGFQPARREVLRFLRSPHIESILPLLRVENGD